MNLSKRMIASAFAFTLCFTGISSLDTSVTDFWVNNINACAEEKGVWDGSIDTSWYDSQETELHISTAEEFAGLSSIVNGGKTMKGQTIILDDDIYLNSLVDTHKWNIEPPQNNWTPIGTKNLSFEGCIEGNNKTIYGLYFKNDTFKTASGLFGSISDGYIKDLNVRYAYTYNSGSILCGINNGSIINCTVDAKAFGMCAFGGISLISNGTISNCLSQGIYTLNTNTAADNGYLKIGIGGICASGNADNCVNEADIFAAFSNYAGGVIAKGNGSELKNYGTLEFNNITVGAGGVCGNGSVISGTNEGKIKAVACTAVGGVIGSGDGSDLNNNSTITGKGIKKQLGGVIGSAVKKIDYCYNKSEIISDAPETGGIAGSSLLDIYSCVNTGEIEASGEKAGGIVGYFNGTSLKCCGNSGNVTAKKYVGGVAGSALQNNEKFMSYCYNKGKVTATESDSSCGGIIGTFHNNSKVGFSLLSCYNTGDISGTNNSGGLIGELAGQFITNNTIKNCYSAASDIEGTNCGGLLGSVTNRKYSLLNCYYLNSGATKGIGDNSADAGITKSEVNMKKEAFRNVLGDPFYYINTEYPVLCWERGLLVIELNKTEVELDEYHKTEQLSASELNEQITWKTSDESVAVVDENGLIKAVGNGTCVVSAVIGKSKCDCYVSVSFDYYLGESGFRLDVDKGKTITVYSRSTGKPVDVSELKFTSSNPKVASVNNKGVVSANAPGTAYIDIEIGTLILQCKVVVPTLMYDVNEDGIFTVADVVTLQNWLLADPNAKIENWKAADLCKDNRIDTYDLLLMKKELLNK